MSVSIRNQRHIHRVCIFFQNVTLSIALLALSAIMCCSKCRTALRFRELGINIFMKGLKKDKF